MNVGAAPRIFFRGGPPNPPETVPPNAIKRQPRAYGKASSSLPMAAKPHAGRGVGGVRYAFPRGFCEAEERIKRRTRVR